MPEDNSLHSSLTPYIEKYKSESNTLEPFCEVEVLCLGCLDEISATFLREKETNGIKYITQDVSPDYFTNLYEVSFCVVYEKKMHYIFRNLSPCWLFPS